MLERYLEARDEAHREGKRIRERYQDDADTGKQAALDATRYGVETRLELSGLVDDPTQNDWTEWKTKARLLGYDTQDRVRHEPFTALAPDEQDEFLWWCAYFDDRPYDYPHSVISQYETARALYTEFETLVSAKEWKHYLRNEPQTAAEANWFADLRTLGVGKDE